MANELPKMNISTKTSLKDVLKLAEDCKKCNNCCKYSSGYLIEGDSKKIAKFLNISEKKLKEDFLEEGEKYNTKLLRPKMLKKDKPYGECIFLDEKEGCSIHEVKPLHCKVGGCNEHGEDLHLWFTINYFVNKTDPESIRQWAAYLKTHPTITGGHLQDLVPDEKKLKQILNFEILR
jgi:Fe-S-cluster containining protein|tara:strand:+ start:66 stop:596 length:531 start_codon:yes stop_codon:yes gene_type:complete